jgi:CRISPR-associated protein Csd1
MTILQALSEYYDKMAERGEVQLPGWTRQKINYCLILSPSGEVKGVTSFQNPDNPKEKFRLLDVPSGPVRKSNIIAYFLWDKTEYIFGRSLDENAKTLNRWEKSKEEHLDRLGSLEDDGAKAVLRFYETWDPVDFVEPIFTKEMLNKNFVFRLEGDEDQNGRPRYIHERPVIRELVNSAETKTTKDKESNFCLVTGLYEEIELLHTPIKGVDNAQPSGAYIVSFNRDSFTSYGKLQGYNAPISKKAAFQYSAVLNRFLDKGSPNRLKNPIGDTTVVFWTNSKKQDDLSCSMMKIMLEGYYDIDIQATNLKIDQKIANYLNVIANGKFPADLEELKDEKFYVLGLAPNTSRLMIRYWNQDTFGNYMQCIQQHYQDMELKPKPLGWNGMPSVNRLLAETTAILGEYKNIPKGLSGDVMRSVLTGGNYPTSLLAAIIIRLRVLKSNNDKGWHIALIKAIINRNLRISNKQGALSVSLNPEEKSISYQIGRLFALLEIAQKQAQGKINATIRDKYYSSASSTPARVFPLLIKNAQNHLSKMRKENKSPWLEGEIGKIINLIDLDFPRFLNLEDQGRFAVGYHHQRFSRYSTAFEKETSEVKAELQDQE